MAGSDLTPTIQTPSLPALDQLRIDFNETSSKMRAALQTISHNAAPIAVSSQQIQSASNDLARRTEQQAASVEETAAALEQITTTVVDSSHRAREAGQMVRRTKQSAEHSGKVVGEAVDAMGKIEQSAGGIGNSIGVVDEIAFQTNLLALNLGQSKFGGAAKAGIFETPARSAPAQVPTTPSRPAAVRAAPAFHGNAALKSGDSREEF
ncbi:Methyl-accepting chemotaxis protein (MCP) signalling domain-containing protein [Rhizobium sp. RU20A]|nr:Methyl-accepting chemotaxis protein (MCP) signalling domain-containing protein [Rhizobium sp. RU20A]